jgi:Fe-S-cluster containining protein
MAECAKCGHCCRSMILEIMGIDVLREPRWRRWIEKFKDVDYTDWEKHPLDVIFLIRTPCPFIRPDNTCAIYASRPDMCVAFDPDRNVMCWQNPNRPNLLCDADPTNQPGNE